MLISSSNPSGALVIGFIAGVVAFFKGFREYRKYRLIADTPRIRIVSAPMGLVNVRGTAQSTETVLSPVSRMPCCFFRVDIKQWKSEGRSSGWRHVRTDMDGPRFHVADDSGRILVDLHGAECDLPQTAERVVDSSEAFPAFGDFHALDGSPAPNVPPTDEELLRYVEYTGVSRISRWIQSKLDTGAPSDDPATEQTRQAYLDVLRGMTAAGSTSPGAPPIAAIQKVMEAKAATGDAQGVQMLQMFNEHTAAMRAETTREQFFSAATGRYKLTECLVLPGLEYEIIGTCVENPSPLDEGDHNLIVKGREESTFEISCEPEAELEADTRSKAMLMIFGGAIAAVACLYLLLLVNKLL